jgi:hypothetical protein
MNLGPNDVQAISLACWAFVALATATLVVVILRGR